MINKDENYNNKLNLIYTVDDSFLPLVSTSLVSVIENNKGKSINVFVATDKDETTDNYIKLVKHHSSDKVHIKHVNARKYDYIFDDYKMNKWGSNSYYIYWRLVIPEIIDVDYAIYIDADILCLQSISLPDLSDKACGCVIDSVHSCYNKLMNVNYDFCFFNTGTIFIDIKKWKEKRLTDKCIDYVKKIKSNFYMADQDLFSLALQDEIEIISPKYNWFAGYDYYGIHESFLLYSLNKKRFYTENELNDSKKEIIFYHCLDGVFKRPWSINNEHPVKDKYNYYKIKSAWPNFEKEEKLPSVMKIEKNLEYILPKNLYYKIHNFSIRLMLKNKSK